MAAASRAGRKVLRLTPQYAAAAAECIAESFSKGGTDPFSW
jgi:hypothetical protein